MQVETIIHARWVIPVEPHQHVLSHHSVVVQEGRIIDVLPSQQAPRRYQAHVDIHLDEHALLPGLVNAHGHAPMTLMRGFADDLPLMSWLNDYIWPAEQKWISPEFVYDGALLACAEMLRGGTTCFADMYFFPDSTARAAEHAGIRAVIGLIMIDFPSAYAQNPKEYLHKGIQLHDQLRSNPLISTMFAPHAPYTVSDEPFEQIATLAEELDIPVQMHVHEIEEEIHNSQEQFQMRPLARLEKLGLLTPRLLAVHMAHLSDEEINGFAAAGAHVVHCPESNLKLASGFCPVQKLLDAGINVALGTDGAASNNDLDMIGEMRSAAILGKAVAKDASATSAPNILRMATINGARALGLEEHIGSIEPGKAADLMAVQLGDLETQPVYNPISQVVYAASRHQVSDVWVAGRHLLKDRQLTTIDTDELIANAKQWALRLGQSQDIESAAE